MLPAVIVPSIAATILPAASRTVTANASAAEQATRIVPIGNMLPEAGAHATGRTPSTRSAADGLKLTTAPDGVVAVAEMSAGSVSVGGRVSTTVSAKSADPMQPLAACA